MTRAGPRRADADGVHVRAETEADRARVFEVEAAAFPTADEAELFEALRTEADPLVSLVAERAGRLVGHACLTPVTLDASPPGATFGALGPIAVEPDAQGRGIGGMLIETGLERGRALGWRAVFLVGDPGYYGRFGFELAAPLGFTYGDAHLDAALQVRALASGALEGCRGRVLYAPAFGQPREG